MFKLVNNLKSTKASESNDNYFIKTKENTTSTNMKVLHVRKRRNRQLM